MASKSKSCSECNDCSEVKGMARFYGLDAGISIGVTAFMLTGPDTGALLRSGEITGFAAAASGIGAYYLAMHLLRKEQ